MLINITGGPDLTLYEVNEASTLIQEAAHEDANIIFGAVIDESIPEGEIRVTVIATGLDGGRADAAAPRWDGTRPDGPDARASSREAGRRRADRPPRRARAPQPSRLRRSRERRRRTAAPQADGRGPGAAT